MLLLEGVFLLFHTQKRALSFCYALYSRSKEVYRRLDIDSQANTVMTMSWTCERSSEPFLTSYNRVFATLCFLLLHPHAIMSEATGPPPEAAPAAAMEAGDTASESQTMQDVTSEGHSVAEPSATAEQAIPPSAEPAEEATSMPSVSNEPAAAPVAARGRGRGRGRGGAANKRGGSAKTAAAASPAATTGPGRGRGKRKSEAAALAQDAGIEAIGNTTSDNAIEEPRKRRKAAQKAKRVIEESGDEDDNDDGYPDSKADAPLSEAVQQDQDTEMQVDQANETPTAPMRTATTQDKPAKRTLKVKLAIRRDSQNAESPAESPVESIPAPPEQHSETLPAATLPSDTEPPPTAIEVQSEVSAEPETIKAPAEPYAPKKEVPVALPNLFDDDEPQQHQTSGGAIGNEQVSPRKESDTMPSSSNEAQTKDDTESSTKPSKMTSSLPSSSQSKQSPASGGTPSAAAGSNLAKKKPTLGAKALGNKSVSGSGTPSGSTSSTLIKKRVLKPGVAGSSTPKASTTSTPARAPQPETSFLDALFADTIPQTEHERQLQREREERTRKEQAAKVKKAKDDAEAKKKALAASSIAAASKPSTAGLVPAGGKPPPVALQSIKTANAGRVPGTSVLSRLGGSEKLRQAEIDKLRAEARQQQEKLAEVSGSS